MKVGAGAQRLWKESWNSMVEWWSGGVAHQGCSLRHERRDLMETGTQSKVHVIDCIFLIPIYPSDYPSV